MKQAVNSLKITVAKAVAKVAFNTALASAGTTCFYTSYQPKLPKGLEKYK